MRALDLTKLLKPYKSGWVAINTKSKKVVAHEKDFEKISNRVKDSEDVLLVPASQKYFGFVTSNA